MKYRFVYDKNHKKALYINAKNYEEAIKIFFNYYDTDMTPWADSGIDIFDIIESFEIFVDNMTNGKIVGTLHPYKTGSERMTISSFAV